MGELRSMNKGQTHPLLDSAGGLAGPQQASPPVGKACQASPHLQPINVGQPLEQWQFLWHSFTETGEERLRAPLPVPAWKDWVPWVIVLWNDAGSVEDPKRSKTEVLDCWLFLPAGVFFAGLSWNWILHRFWNVTEEPAILSACLMLLTRCCNTLGSGHNTWDPSKGAVRMMLRTCGWNPKFWSRASLRSNCRFEAATKPEGMVVNWASWMIASFSSSSNERSSLGDNSEMTEATIESAKEAYMADLQVVLWESW